ncbi:hypothetical protein ANCCAN_27901 [Ancylostoma caninum]|uniref:Uncharacterized protein n=1 Tax=Ancylostoma caninum TaxID=29170 RepID=A0A368F2Q0_ANCCA|nr:hypothetical protein ANCCAN_27901 [Ancylostoma caninum]
MFIFSHCPSFRGLSLRCHLIKVLQEKFISEIDALTWESACGGPPPQFPRTPMLQRGRQPKSANSAASTSSTPAERLEGTSGNLEGTASANGTPKPVKEKRAYTKKTDTPKGMTEKKRLQVELGFLFPSFPFHSNIIMMAKASLLAYSWKLNIPFVHSEQLSL